MTNNVYANQADELEMARQRRSVPEGTQADEAPIDTSRWRYAVELTYDEYCALCTAIADSRKWYETYMGPDYVRVGELRALDEKFAGLVYSESSADPGRTE